MNIYINNKLQELPHEAKIKDALSALDITVQKGIAIAVNNNVIPHTEWESFTLQADDKMMLIRATQVG